MSIQRDEVFLDELVLPPEFMERINEQINEIKERINAAQQSAELDEDFWETVPPALAERINAAIRSLSVRRRDLYKQIWTPDTSGSLDDKDLWASIDIAKMEDCFAYRGWPDLDSD